jgi:uncharacterized lipoprotein YmbA
MRRTAHLTALCAVAALAAGCSTTPSSFYTLSHSAPATATSTGPSSQVAVLVGPVSIPAIVDQPEMVISTGPNQVSIDEFHRWASPLAGDITRVVAENLVTMLGTPRVSQFQQALNAPADYRVIIEVQGFVSEPGDAATLNAFWIVRRTKDGKTETGRTVLREPTADKSYDALVAAHSRALARMSQDIADAVRALDRAPS